MKLTRVEIENFKGIRKLELDLRGSDGQPRPLTLLLGDNGSGKTSALQAIALVLSMASRRIERASDFAWPGFLAERVGSLGPTRVALEVAFDAEERQATRELDKLWAPLAHRELRHSPNPADSPTVSLVFERDRLPVATSETAQFLGRWYIRTLVRSRPDLRERFPEVGDVFWFDQNRSNQTAAGTVEETPEPPGIERLRDFLVGWWAFHTSPGKRGIDYLGTLEQRYAELFPGSKFVGVAPREFATATRATESYFLIERDGKRYDIAEMSSGEQAVFPILYEFVRLSIAKSVVLIDELELHLHPPEQQALLAALRRIGPDCQFICTTHSPYLEQVTPEENEIRLPGGRPCL